MVYELFDTDIDSMIKIGDECILAWANAEDHTELFRGSISEMQQESEIKMRCCMYQYPYQYPLKDVNIEADEENNDDDEEYIDEHEAAMEYARSGDAALFAKSLEDEDDLATISVKKNERIKSGEKPSHDSYRVSVVINKLQISNHRMILWSEKSLQEISISDGNVIREIDGNYYNVRKYEKYIIAETVKCMEVRDVDSLVLLAAWHHEVGKCSILRHSGDYEKYCLHGDLSYVAPLFGIKRVHFQEIGNSSAIVTSPGTAA